VAMRRVFDISGGALALVSLVVTIYIFPSFSLC